jgi:hypothetical protein
VKINLRDGISPDEAATLAVVPNPTLRADRYRKGLASAQPVQVGVLPNPQFSYSLDKPVAGNMMGRSMRLASVPRGTLPSFWRVYNATEGRGVSLRPDRQAIQQTFHRRGTPLIGDPICFTAAFAESPAKSVQWTAFLRRNKFSSVVPNLFPVVANFIAEFLRLVTLAALAGQPTNSTWKAANGWML